MVIWRCPVCHGEESLRRLRVLGILSLPAIRCSSCRALWICLLWEAMWLVRGPREHRGLRSLHEWADLASGPIQLWAETGVEVPVVLRPGEGVVKLGWAGLCEERVRKVSSGSRLYIGFSFRVARGLWLHAGERLPDASRTVSERRLIDQGHLVLTNRRLVFTGSKKPANMDLSRIFTVKVDGGLLQVGCGSRTYHFFLHGESPWKWETYIRGVIQRVGRTGHG